MGLNLLWMLPLVNVDVTCSTKPGPLLTSLATTKYKKILYYFIKIIIIIIIIIISVCKFMK